MPEQRSAGAAAALVVAALVVGGALGFLWGRGASGPDVSEAGQISYGCALAEKVRAGHQTEDDWGRVDEDHAFNELAAIPGLLGVAAPQGGEESNAFAGVGWNRPSGPGGGGLDEVHENLDATIELCESR